LAALVALQVIEMDVYPLMFALWCDFIHIDFTVPILGEIPIKFMRAHGC